MDKYVPKDMTGSLFRNDKGDNEKRPDYRGDAMVNGELMEMAAWLRESAKGIKYMSITFKPKEDAPAKPAPKRQPVMADVPHDDIPFSDPYKGRKANAI